MLNLVRISACVWLSRYVSVLGAVYLRLVGKPFDIYSMLEPMYSDYRKIRKRNVIGTYVHTQTAVLLRL